MAEGRDTLRVSVVGGHERVDLVVPAGVRVAELLAELVPRLVPVGSLEARLSVLGGPPLEPGSGLAAQGVVDGAVLTVTTAADHAAVVRRDDDLATVVAEAADRAPRPALRWTGPVVAAALLGLGAAGVAALATPTAAVVAAATSGLLLVATAAASRRAGPSATADTAAWLAVTHAGAAGLVSGVVGAGAAWVVAGAAAALASGRRCGPPWAATVAGLVLVVAGGVAGWAPAPLVVVLGCTLVAVVATGDLHPWLAAALAGLVAPRLGEESPAGPDGDAVAAAVRRAHELLLVGAVATGLLLAVLAPVVAAGGPWGIVLALDCCAVVALRSGRQRAGAAGPVGRLGAVVTLLPVAVAVAWSRPESWLVVVAVVVGAGLVLLVAAVRPVGPSARAGRAAELAEALALVALPPVLLAATGLLDVVRGLVA